MGGHGTITTSTTPSRRNLLKGAAAAGVAATVLARGTQRARASTEAATGYVPTDLNLHLLRRATFGPTPAALTEIRNRGRTGWLNRQLDPSVILDTAFEDMIATRFPRLGWSLTKAYNELEGSWDLMFDLGYATLARACWSKRQLLEVMVDFWSNHLNVTNPSDNVWHSRADYDRTVIRAHALGRFEDMLVASATHPAMMLYLDNASSTKDNPNENYGRELLELHSVSVDGGYDEDDMRNSTLVMTGFGFDWDTGLFRYWKDDHHVGPVSVMGWSHANGSSTGGYNVGLAYVRYLANHPSTAAHIAHKLCLRFVSDTPPQALVDALAETYLDNGTDIRPVLERVFTSTEFTGSLGAKVRRPMEDLAATVRILNIKHDISGREGMEGLYWMVEGLGQPPQSWPQPDGFPDHGEAWRSAGGLLSRWNMHMSLAAHWWPKALVRPPLKNLLPSPLPATHGPLVQALARRLLFKAFTAAQRDAVLSLIGKTATSPLKPTSEAVTWRLPYLVSLILSSPHFQIR